ncbi:hypothetical protein QBC47DRAFT_380690 [Echria macrotheca]|uniref:Uncharacterized protein n=1 Tax=Echria macrotheca TaxID=438768 RepID=A0AAJ0BC49_9PEZI|nr:hypothetical protein QBC47DRAFT_380690 [Echria macrotheca]
MAMAGPEDRFFIYENRLASFQGAQPVTKRRTSNATSRAPKALHWPHKSLSPVDLAKAGFFFEPFPGSPDNVVCFLCNKSLDGWEADDKPLEEHVKHSPDCGWAVMAALEADLGDFAKIHPLDPRMVEARKATFAGRWPYESKKGFKCKAKQLAEAGWKYTPTLESDDMATCAYCQLGLDGWEAGDKPIDEHYKRSPDCPFFQLISQLPQPKKASRAKTAGPSKASRLSTQSVATVATAVSDLHSLADITADHDDSVMTTSSTMTQGGRKTTKGKKAATKPRKTRAKKDDPVEILEDEPRQPEDPTPQKPARGRKRASDAMDEATTMSADAPPAKKRATRVKANAADQSAASSVTQDADMTDAPAVKPAPKKKGQTPASKPSRKASQSSLRSQASTASLRAPIPDDEEIERQLQADLERPLTDDENLDVSSDAEGRAAPAPAKGRPKKTATRKASAQSQKVSSKAYAMLDPSPAEPTEAEIEAELKALETEMEEVQEKPAETLVVPKKGRKTGTRKVSKQKKAKEPAPVAQEDELIEDGATASEHTEATASEHVSQALPDAEAPIEHPTQTGPKVLEDPDVSTGTVVNQAAGRSSLEKRGPGRPPKRKTTSQASAEPEQRRSSGIPVQIEVQIASKTSDPSFLVASETPEKTAKPVEASRAPAQAAVPPSVSRTPPPAASMKGEKTLPPRPQSASRLPRPPATPRANATPSANAKQATLSPSQSPQSSDAENQPPSSRPAASAAAKRVVLAPVVATPMRTSPSKRNVVAGLQSTTPWTAVDLDMIFSPSDNKENAVDKLLRKGGELTSPEKRMTVEEWIYHNAGLAEQKLKHECEMMVSTFEREGSKAMHVLEGLIVD